MRLHQLTIQSFGPFAEREVIDFDSLGQQALFLIDGPTGAGKSSILHAICFALYGEITDTERGKGLGIRSDYASDDTLTEIILEFSVKQSRYRIHRIPTQLRPAKKGQGVTEQKSTAELSIQTDQGDYRCLVPKKVSEADQTILSIIGLNAEQFRQVMVLPQGKFRDLLLAKSDDRQAILSTLFQTDIYKKIEQSLKEKALDIDAQYKQYERSKLETLSDSNTDSFDALCNQIADLATQSDHANEQKIQAQNRVQQTQSLRENAKELQAVFHRLSEVQNQYHSWQATANEIALIIEKVAQAERALTIMPIWQSYASLSQDQHRHDVELKQTSESVASMSQEFTAVSVAFAHAEARYQQRDELKQECKQLEAFKLRHQTLQQLEVDLTNASQSHHAKKESIKTQQATLTALKTQQTDKNTQLSDLIKRCKPKAALTEQRIKLEHQLKSIEQLNTLRHQLSQLELDQKTKETILSQIRDEFVEKRHFVKHLELRFYKYQAAILAAELEEGMPCAVCGSKSHPNPALMAEDAPSQAEVDAHKDVLQLLETKGSQAKSDYDVVSNSVQNKLNEIQLALNELGTDQDITYEVIADHLANIKQQLTAIDSVETEITHLQSSLAQLESELTDVQQRLTQLEAVIPQLLSNEVKAKTALESAYAELPKQYQDIRELERKLASILSQIETLELTYQNALKAKTELEQIRAVSEARYSDLIKAKVLLDERVNEANALWEQTLTQSKFQSQEAFLNASLEPTVLEQYRQQIKQHESNGQILKAEIDVLNTQLKDKQNPDLETLEQEVNLALSDYKHAEQIWADLEKQKTSLDNAKKKFERLEEQQRDVKKAFETIGTLSNVASGKGKIKVSLERFVLGNLLDSVLSIASQRLYVMSRGQYRLLRQNESDQKKNQTAGLDLAIDDAHTGKMRPVSTLSGGESFMASLSLALALSDVVQERSGGIQLDTLFIDEGFGSLDQESLQLAILTLVDIQASGRSIGIISHVSELKEQMAKRIEVQVTRKGSRVALVK
jgi:exonuclease SbcC